MFESCGTEVVGGLLDAGYEVIARPHPMTAKRTPDVIPALRDRFGSHARFTLDEDMASAATLQRADLMVSDWSGAALEYTFGLERPVLFVDVPRKINNPDYQDLGIEPFEATVRERVGEVVSVEDLASLPERVDAMIGAVDEYRARIVAARSESIDNVGASGVAGAKLIAAKADAFLARGR